MADALKQLLVHFDDTPAALARLHVARRLAAGHGAEVTAFYAVTPILFDVPMAAEAGAEAVAALLRIDEERMARARQAFDAAIGEAPGVPTHWACVDTCPVAAAFHDQALYADLVVLGQRPQRRVEASGVPIDLVESTLGGSGRPALVVPAGWTPAEVARDIAVAWKPTREAARAVTAALPLLRSARKVHVMAWGERPPDGIRGSRLDLDRWLRSHGVEARWYREPGPEPDFIGEALLTRAFDLQADLLVMGCYGHSRLHEWMLGGASRTVLESMTQPVLMAH